MKREAMIVSGIFFIFLLIPLTEASTTVILQDANTENLEDTYVEEEDASSNFGSSQQLYVDGSGVDEIYAYVKFNLSSIPQNSTITNATFYTFWSVNYDAEERYFYHVYNQTWKETQLTWNSQPFSDGDINLTYVRGTKRDGSWVMWYGEEIIDMIQKDHDNLSNSNFSIMVEGTFLAGANNEYFYSKEFVTASYRTYLNVTYNAPEPVFNVNYTTPREPLFNSNTTITVNITDVNGIIVNANFTVEYPDGTYINDELNGSVYNTNMWNSSKHFFTNQTGDYNITVTASDDEGYNVTKQWNFTVSLGTLNINVTDEGDTDYTFSVKDNGEEFFNISIGVSGGNSNSTINITKLYDLANTSALLIPIYNFTLVNGSVNTTLINITVNTTGIKAGTYGGFLNISRFEDSSFTLIEINITVSSISANLDIVNATFTVNTQQSSGSYFWILIWNKGDWNASECNLSLTTSADVTATYGNTSFGVTNETNTSINITLTGGTTTSADASSVLTVTCNATKTNGIDTDSIVGAISNTATQVTGGGGGDQDQQLDYCGDGVCSPERNETFSSCPIDCIANVTATVAYGFEQWLITPIAWKFNPIILVIFLFGGGYLGYAYLNKKHLNTQDKLLALALIGFIIFIGLSDFSLADTYSTKVDAIAGDIYGAFNTTLGGAT